MPFANLSADRENEYFSDGLAEEILNALSGVAELRVAARSSNTPDSSGGTLGFRCVRPAAGP